MLTKGSVLTFFSFSFFKGLTGPPRDFRRAKPEGNPVLLDFFTHIYILFLICFHIGLPEMHRRFRIGLPKIQIRFRIGPPKMHRQLRIGPPQVFLNLFSPEFTDYGIVVEED